MKRTKKNRSLFLFVGIAILFSSCRKFVQIEPSDAIIATGNVFEKNSSATAAQLSIYAQMQGYPFKIKWVTGLSSDELKNYSSNLTSVNLYLNNLNAINDGRGLGLFSQGFNFIYQANAIIEAMQSSTGVTASAKKQLTGESKFVRAWWNFYLVNLYGDIPIVTSTNYATNASLTRSPKADVYAQIVADLIDAQNLLNTSFVDITDTVLTTERIRPTKWAATALLARAYLHMGKWSEAEAQATAVINSNQFNLVSNLNSVFLKNSPEAILQLQSPSTSTFTPDGGFILTTSPLTSTSSVPRVTLSDQLLNSFEAGDSRKSSWVSSFSVTSPTINTWYYCNKFKAISATVSANPALANTEYVMMLRLAEQYLIRAEAIARQGSNLTAAIADLNKIRNRANLQNYLGPTDQTSVLAAIMRERQIELFAEGHRWLDLKRTNTVESVMTSVTPQKGGIWNTNQQLYPLPTTDIDNSIGKLAQNPGY